MRTRRLTLQRETLAALSTDDLTLVAGGAPIPSMPQMYCIKEFIDRHVGQTRAQ